VSAMRVLFVCSGNTCRSPLAEVLFRRMMAEQDRTDVEVASAGTGAYDGAPASEGAYLVALERGLDLGAHRARLLTPEIVAGADLILTMSRGHLSRVERLGGGAKAWLLGEYANDGEGPVEVRDPFGADVDTYRHTLEQLDALLRVARDRLVREHPA